MTRSDSITGRVTHVRAGPAEKPYGKACKALEGCKLTIGEVTGQAKC